MTINVPTNWNEISLKTFDLICKIPESSKDYSREVLKVVCNLSDEDIDSLKMTDYLTLVDKLSWMNQYPPVNKLPKDKIVISNKEFSVLMFPNRMTASQFIDYRYLLLNDSSDIKQAKLLAIFIVPTGSSYNDGSYDFDEVAQFLYDNLSIEYALGLSTFFVTVSMVFLQASLNSSAQNLKKILRGEKDKSIVSKIKESLKQMKIIKKDLKQTIKNKNNRIRALMKPIGHR